MCVCVFVFLLYFYFYKTFHKTDHQSIFDRVLRVIYTKNASNLMKGEGPSFLLIQTFYFIVKTLA